MNITVAEINLETEVKTLGPKSNLDIPDETYKRTSDRKSKTEL
jgi:hypothetical protein